jgi:hypothetical protein
MRRKNARLPLLLVLFVCHGYLHVYVFSSIQFVQEFLEETLAQRGIDVVPQTFHMDSLLQEMREIESARHSSLPPIPAPGVAQALADGEGTGWADQFSEMPGKLFDVSKNYCI